MSDLLAIITPAHVGIGVLAVASGAVALAARKGHTVHVGAGRMFLAALVASSALGAGLGLMHLESHYITFHAGVLAMTLVASGWLAARGGDRIAAVAAWLVGLINLANAAALVVAGLLAQNAPDGLLLGFPAADYLFLSGMALLGVAGDANRIVRRTAFSERQRIARHLWRMCLGFFIAAGSAFTGPGASAFPDAVKESGVLVLPELIIISLMLFWLVRTLGWGAKKSHGGIV